jgi:hypothetical protein
VEGLFPYTPRPACGIGCFEGIGKENTNGFNVASLVSSAVIAELGTSSATTRNIAKII